MASTAITADQLLARVKARAQMPATDGRLTDAEILALIDDLTLTSLGREVYDADDGRWIKTAADVAIASGVATHRLPDRAFASGLDEVILIASDGTPTQLDYVDRADVWGWGTTTGVPHEYAILGDVIHLLPTPSSSTYSLRVRYVRRPSRLALVANNTLLTAAAAATLSGTIGAGWTSPTTIDVVEGTNNVEALEDDVAITFTGTTITRTSSGSFTTTGAYAVAAGDYACLAGTTCVVQVPDVAIPYLADLAARDVCVALMDMEGASAAGALAEQRRKDMAQAIAERSRTRPKIVQRNSPLRIAGMRAARWRR